jgi:hypothetical protein
MFVVHFFVNISAEVKLKAGSIFDNHFEAVILKVAIGSLGVTKLCINFAVVSPIF